MLAVFLLGVAPKEYLHELLYHHTDTVDPVYKKGEFVISNKHIHCSFLAFGFAPYISAEKQFLSFKEIPFYTNYILPCYQCYYTTAQRVLSLRGPPVTC